MSGRGPVNLMNAPTVVTPWRREATSLKDKIVSLIRENADPEVQYRLAADISQDIVHDVAQELRRVYGQTFDRLIDGSTKVVFLNRTVC
jgi:hypothetical protein